MEKALKSLEDCPLNYAISSINGKWKLFIIWYLNEYGKPCRFGELMRIVPYEISTKVFSQQLRELVRDKIVYQNRYNEKVLRVEYGLTEDGKLLLPLIYYLRDWGAITCDKFTEEDLKRTKGCIDGETIEYSCSSETISKAVNINFKYK